MNSPATTVSKNGQPAARTRSTLNVDLGELRSQVMDACDAEGVKPSEWLRRAVRQALGSASEAAEGAQAGAAAEPQAGRTLPGRGVHIELDPAAAEVLDGLVARGEYRSRVAALRALLDGIGAVGGGDGEGLSAALRALVTSNNSLVYVSRDLANVVKHLQARSSDAGAIPVAWRLEVEGAVKAARDHVQAAGKLIERLAPLVKTPSAEDDK
jgi:Arc/MetJ-type ribon-helix-helix transcriptional regulator